MRHSALLLAIPLYCAAQSIEPPVLIRLLRYDASVNSDLIRRYADGQAALNVIGLSPVTGPAEQWLVELHDNFAGIEAVDLALARSPQVGGDPGGDEILPASRSMIALFRPGWSFRPEEAIRALAKSRYVLVTVARARPGGEADLAESMRQRRFANESVNSNRPDVAYQVIAGAPNGLAVILAPVTSLKIIDDGLARIPIYADSVVRGEKKTESESLREHLIFRIDPARSYTSKEFAESDPEFWRGK